MAPPIAPAHDAAGIFTRKDTLQGLLIIASPSIMREGKSISWEAYVLDQAESDIYKARSHLYPSHPIYLLYGYLAEANGVCSRDKRHFVVFVFSNKNQPRRDDFS